MDELGLELFSSDQQKKTINKMPLFERAKIKCWPDYLSNNGINRFPDYLSIKELCSLFAPIYDYRSKPSDKSLHREWNDKRIIQSNKNKAFKELLIDACKKPDGLSYEGDITGWEYFGDNPHPLARAGFGGVYIPDDTESHFSCTAEDCTIHKAEFKRYFKSIDKWKIVNNGLLAGWWEGDTDEAINQPQLLKQTEEAESKEGKKPLGKKNKKRIEILKEFIKDLDESAQKDGFCFDPFKMECNKKNLLIAIQKWAEKIKKDRATIKLFNIKEFDNSLWSSDKRKKILGVQPSSHNQHEKYFKNFKIMIS